VHTLPIQRCYVGWSFEIIVDVANPLDYMLLIPSLLESPSPSPSQLSARHQTHTHIPKTDWKLAADSTKKTESEIWSPQDPIVYLSCRVYDWNCWHHNIEALWDVIIVGMLKISFRLPYRLHYFGQHMLPAICHMPHTTCCLPPAARQSLPTIHHDHHSALRLASATQHVAKSSMQDHRWKPIVNSDWECLPSW